MDEFYLKHMYNIECPGDLMIQTHVSLDSQSGMLVQDDGSTIIKYRSGFCVDHFNTSQNTIELSAFICNSAPYEMENKTLEGTCGDKDLVNFNQKLRTAYTYLGLFSVIFLVITLFVYCTLPRLKNLHGKIVICNVTSILITTTLLILIYNVHRQSEGGFSVNTSEFLIFVPPLACSGLGYALYIAGLSMFCWMSVMCIDLCWTFARKTIPR